MIRSSYIKLSAFIFLFALLCSLLPTASNGQTPLADTTICLPIPTFKKMVELIEVGRIDSSDLALTRQNLALAESSFEAMTMQAESFNDQLNVAVNKYNDLNKDYSASQKRSKGKSFVIIGLTLLSTILLIK